MTISNRGLDLIKKWEGLSLTPYKDAAGYWTVGYGLCLGKTLPDEFINGISEQTAERYLGDSVKKAESAVDIYYKYNFNQNQYDALVSFAYNVGNIKQLTADGTRTIEQIASKIPEYCNAGGVKLRGLYNRRMEELSLFLEPVEVADDIIESTTGLNVPFLFKVTINNLLIRTDAGKDYSFVKDRNNKAMYTGKGVFTITEVKNNWGKLKSGLGWICLDSDYGYRLK